MPVGDTPFEDLFFEEFFGHRWAVNGNGRTITWTVSDDTVDFPGLGTVVVDVGIGGSLLSDVRRAIDYWDDALDTISFEFRSNRSDVDLTFGIASIDGPSNILGVWESETTGDRIDRAAILFDTDDTPLSPFSTTDSFFTVALHEIGNVLGLGDIAAGPDVRSVMEDPLAELVPETGGLWAFDVALIKRYYGETTEDPPPQEDPTDPEPTPVDDDPDRSGGLPTFDPGGGGPTGGRFTGTSGDDVLDGTPGDDTFAFSEGFDRIAGEGGSDTLLIYDRMDAFTIRLESAANVGAQAFVFNRDDNPEGSGAAPVGASIVGIERIIFDNGNDIFTDGVMNLSEFEGIRRLETSELLPLAEMYIAYFDRAPDAVGLSYWGTRLADGMSMEEIAESFFVQPETQARYPANMDNATLVQTAYNNFLGRDPDQAGWDYWTQELDTGLSRGTFMLSLINGARDNSSPEAILDTQTIQQKTEIGLYYAGFHGLSDTDAAQEAMALFERDSTETILAAETFIDNHAFETSESGPDAEFRLDLRDLIPSSAWDIA